MYAESLGICIRNPAASKPFDSIRLFDLAMMKTYDFEIKVAVIGYVSVGKSTVLNALFGRKYSDVAMRRATAAINHFRVSTPPDYTQEPIRTADSTLTETMEDNVKLRDVSSASNGRVQEKKFVIELDDPLCDMRENTSLVFVDVPGINEADRSMYKSYIHDNWDGFDCVVVVMDAIQGANTQEQVSLLRFVSDNVREKKDIPVIILGNKIDDPDDEEMLFQVEELRQKVAEVFGGYSPAKSTPQLIPISAKNAFVYRYASGLDFEEFKKLDKELIDKIGKDEVGKSQWKKLLQFEDKLKVAYDAIHNKGTESRVIFVSGVNCWP